MGQPLVPHLGYRQDNINLFNIKRTQGEFVIIARIDNVAKKVPPKAVNLNSTPFWKIFVMIFVNIGC